MEKLIVSQFAKFNDGLSATIASHVEKVAKASNASIDLMFAKFLQETGLPMSKIEMVQEQTPTGHKIYFRARRGRPRKPSDR
jgi:fructose-1,6-bisphosphatase/sedoheptulose 1,7-bisphosphatase-like protein